MTSMTHGLRLCNNDDVRHKNQIESCKTQFQKKTDFRPFSISTALLNSSFTQKKTFYLKLKVKFDPIV